MFAFRTDIGKRRERNEDSCYIIQNEHKDIFMLGFDGMGGHNKGDVASSLAQEIMVKAFLEKKKFNNKLDMYFWLKSLIRRTNKLLNQYSLNNNDAKGMGTTFSCYLLHDKYTLMSYIGDTRCYLIKNHQIIQKSTDETYIEFLYQTGKITKEEKLHHPSSNIITNALGCHSDVVINLAFIKENYDYLLICSDGLYHMLSEEEILEIIDKEIPLQDKTNEMIDLANEYGGKDNILVALYSKGEKDD